MRPLHRSITFWSSILVMAFVCWAWRDSLNWMNYVSRARLHAYSGYGGLFAESIDTRVRTTDYGRGKLPRPEFAQTDRIFQAPSFVRGTGPPFVAKGNVPDRISGRGKTLREIAYNFSKDQSPKSWRLFIPYWLILLAVAIPWTALLLWRARRGRPPTIVETTP